MVRQYYVPQITRLSEQELQSIFESTEPPVCLLGGWAVHFHVNPGFQTEYGRQYIGSRDIDIGVHVDSELAPEKLPDKPVGQSISRIQDMGYTRSRFGFVQNFHRDNEERISEDEASQYGMHEVFQLYVDVIPDTTELDAFDDSFGFRPPAEPLLEPVFDESEGEPLAEYVSWSVSEDVEIVPPALLAAMKIRSLPDRDKSHKLVKDLADLHALLWYVKDIAEIRTEILYYVSDSDLTQLEDAVNKEGFEEAAQLLQIDPELISESITRIFQ